jgi:hypothetical protein
MALPELFLYFSLYLSAGEIRLHLLLQSRL